MSRAPVPSAEALAAVARLPVPTAPAPAASPDLVLYTPATLPLASLALTRPAGDRAPIVVAVEAFGRWRHGLLVSAGSKRLRVAYVTAASPDAVHVVTELPEHVWILTASLPRSTPTEEPAMPARRKPVTTVAEAATAPPLVVVPDPDQPSPAEAAAAEADSDPAVIAGLEAVAASDARIAAGKKRASSKASKAGAAAVADAVQSILSPSAEAGAAGATFIAALPIGRIRPAADNPRASLPELDDLRDSIAEHGVLEPLVVAEAAPQPGDDGVIYDLVFGHRRLAAAGAAGLEAVPAVVRNDLVDRRARVARIVENLQRADLTPMEEARALRDLVDGGMAQKDVAVAISRNPGHVSKRLLLLKLPAEGQALVDSGRLPLDVAADLARLPEADHLSVLQRAHGDPDRIGALVHARAEERRAAGELDKVARELEKGGLTVWRSPGHPSLSLADGPYLLSRLRDMDGYDVPADHRALPCHAALVAPAHSLPYQPPADVEDDPLARYYRLVCTAPELHKADEAAGGAGEPAVDPELAARAAALEERKAAVEALLAARWDAAGRALARKVGARDALVRSRFTHALSLLAELGRTDVEENAWSLTAALLAADPQPGQYLHNYGAGDLPAVHELLGLLPDGEGLERFAYAHALATGHHELTRALRRFVDVDELDRVGGPDEVLLASLYLVHLADLAGGGIPADVVEQAIVLAGSRTRVPEALMSWGLLAEGPTADELAEAAADERPVETVHLPADEPREDTADLIGAKVEELREIIENAPYRRAELGVTRDAEADYGVRIGGGDAYLVPGIKTAKGQCRVCHAQVTIRSGGGAGKHSNDGGPCAGAGERVMTLAEAMPEEATGEPAEPVVDEVACPTCDGVGRDASEQRCRTCAGRGLVAPQLV